MRFPTNRLVYGWQVQGSPLTLTVGLHVLGEQQFPVEPDAGGSS